MNRLIPLGWLSLFLLSGLTAPGCARHEAQAPPGAGELPPPEVMVSLPVGRLVKDYEDFPGRTDAVYWVQLRARVTGYVDKVNFTEGADVKEGDVLFEIDPRPYQAELRRAEANLVQAEAHLERLNLDYKRASGLRPGGAIGQEEYDKIRGDRAEAGAAVGVARASTEMSSLNLNYTKVKAPISGRVSSRFVDPGNLVKADDTILTTIVSFDPMYASFDVDEHNTQRLQKLIREGKLDWSKGAKVPVLLGLGSEEGYPRQGVINFADNSVDPDTGTWRLRGQFANADRALSRGMYVRIRLPIGEPYRAILVAEQALGTDQGQKFVYVVDADNKVDYRRVKIGRLHDGLRVIAGGVAPNDKVVVSGLQRVRQGVKVDPKLVPMPEAGVRGQGSGVSEEAAKGPAAEKQKGHGSEVRDQGTQRAPR